ncbi:chromosome segregation protein SMC [Bacillus sp. MUM 13]|uniref:chromosome segregation protein SMC n=1 Tax=Bacillus sp. MUM 13 TaxID=1678001 RepID=UPI0008F5A49B|nr:chromosome segregation protein SMC [Bacillus sp. MUM 13]OIK15250.1 chromosome segregation protein SMC [Bacillus sp. MUM 13]
MFLKRLDIVGFKSFAERIAVEFVQGVTAVVGPNGSGKSNITDSIRWVLGEQSARSLRGVKMEDIIFAGSDSRKALNFAEVTLTLDNETNSLPIDFQEVSVTRRVYRSGESEFLINKQPCRLKDIIDLFMDSGLGREAFSIISQGKVEEILSSKAEERRVIFEEAAGVLKYKTRKRKAENKLSETQENLNRVNDILFELESQVEPLKIQSSLAKEYLEKKSELEKIEIALTVYEIESLHQKWEKLSKDFAEHSESEGKMSAELSKKEKMIEEIRGKILELDASSDHYQGVLLAASEELEKLEGRKEVLKERKKNAFQNKGQLEKSIEEGSRKITLLNDEKKREGAALQVLEREVQELQGRLRVMQNDLSLFNANIEETIEMLKSDYIDWLNKQASAKNEKQYLEQQISKGIQRGSLLDENNAKFLEERSAIEEKKSLLSASRSETVKKIEEHVHIFRDGQRKLEGAKAAYQKQETTLYQAYQYLQQSRSRKELLEEMEDDYAGFFQGVKEVLKAGKHTLQGIKGAVAELITVPKEYQLAIETALGGAMQHIVVENEVHARQAITFLKKNSYGRATFMPLSVIKPREVPSSQYNLMKGHPSFMGTAAELISYEKQYQAIAANLLGSVIIASDLKGANELAKLVGHKYRFVTTDGDIVNPGGSMTGGALKQKTSSLLSRKAELEELKNKLSGMEEKTNKLEQHVRQLKSDVALLETKINGIRAEGEQLRLEEQSLNGQMREVELLEKNINERLHLYDLDKKAADEDHHEKALRLDELEELLKSSGAEIQRLDLKIAELTEKKKIQQETKESLAEETSELKVKLASKKEQLQHQHEKYSRIQHELAEITEKTLEYKEDLSLLANAMTDSSSGAEKLEESAKKCLQTKNETLVHITSIKEERKSRQEFLDDIELETRELKRLHKGMAEVVKDEEVKLNRLDVELENLLNQLSEEYFIAFEAAKEKYPLAIAPDDARKQVKLIKLSIEELGTVNLGAIEEYERVSERHQFLVAQKDDLQQAKDTLFQVIEEMDDEMKRRFADTFFAIRSEFEHVFKALFGGGKAELKLTDPSDLLKTGVDIIAQPPGKKLQNLGLLSGGERALTAIALLFSILKVRPVPFCILDEVEAALDEANVIRFSQYLKQFSSDTQFIVITHRKGTMEEADVLYGITMQESGVSKLVSVRMEETEEYAPF